MYKHGYIYICMSDANMYLYIHMHPYIFKLCPLKGPSNNDTYSNSN